MHYSEGYGVAPFNHHYPTEHSSDGYVVDPLNHQYIIKSN